MTTTDTTTVLATTAATATAAGPGTPADGGRRFAYLGVAVGLGVSVWANVAHAWTPPAGAPQRWRPESGAIALAGFWPLILFLALEVLTRTRWRAGRAVLVARAGVGVVAAVAAVTSYLHLHGLLQHYGEATVPALLGPLAIDGLMTVSAAALLAPTPETPPAPAAALGAALGAAQGAVGAAQRPGRASGAAAAAQGPVGASAGRQSTTVGRRPARGPAAGVAGAGAGGVTGAAVARVRAAHPDWSAVQIAAELGVTDRTVRRHLSTRAEEPAAAVSAVLPPDTGEAPDAEQERAA